MSARLPPFGEGFRTPAAIIEIFDPKKSKTWIEI
jgi:hypothetical protein